MTINLIAGVFGIMLYTLIKSRQYVYGKKRKDFSFSVMIDENILGLFWALYGLILCWGVLHLIPASSEALGALLGGIQITNTPAGFLLLGNFLGFLGKETTK